MTDRSEECTDEEFERINATMRHVSVTISGNEQKGFHLAVSDGTQAEAGTKEEAEKLAWKLVGKAMVGIEIVGRGHVKWVDSEDSE